MKNNFIITTTSNIEGCPIVNYIGVVCSNIVLGTNTFSDSAAAFTDFWGGRSKSYERKLEIIYKEASKELKQKAMDLGANAIIGFKLDFDEISGKNKSMFMVSASGTACIVEYKANCPESASNAIIPQYELDKEIKRRLIISKINDGASIKEQWVEFLIENPQSEIIDNLLDRYISYYGESENLKEEIGFIEKYISLFPKKSLIEPVYAKYETHPRELKSLIDSCGLFSPQKILLLCQTDCHAAIDLLLTNSDYYQRPDLVVMKDIYRKLTSLPDTGKIETTKGGLLNKEKEKFICQNGHKSSSASIFCENYDCGVNIKGLTNDEIHTIEQFRQRIDIISYLIDNN